MKKINAFSVVFALFCLLFASCSTTKNSWNEVRRATLAYDAYHQAKKAQPVKVRKAHLAPALQLAGNDSAEVETKAYKSYPNVQENAQYWMNDIHNVWDPMGRFIADEPEIPATHSVTKVSVNYKVAFVIPTLKDVETILPADLSLLYLNGVTAEPEVVVEKKTVIQPTVVGGQSIPPRTKTNWNFNSTEAQLWFGLLIIILLAILVFLVYRLGSKPPRKDDQSSGISDIVLRLKEAESEHERLTSEQVRIKGELDDEIFQQQKELAMANRKAERALEKKNREENRQNWWIVKKYKAYKRGKRLKILMAPRLAKRKAREEEKKRIEDEFKKNYPQGGPKYRKMTPESQNSSDSDENAKSSEPVKEKEEPEVNEEEKKEIPFKPLAELRYIPPQVLDGIKDLDALAIQLGSDEYKESVLSSRLDVRKTVAGNIIAGQIQSLIKRLKEVEKGRYKISAIQRDKLFKKMGEDINNLPVTEVDSKTGYEWLQQWIYNRVREARPDFKMELPSYNSEQGENSNISA